MSHSTKVEELLERLLGIEGINGAIAFARNGEVLGTRTTKRIVHDTVSEACSAMVGMMESLGDLAIVPEELIYYFDQNRITIKVMGNGFLLILYDVTANQPMINIAIKFTVNKLTTVLRDLEIEETSVKAKESIPFRPLKPGIEEAEDLGQSAAFISFHEEKMETTSPRLQSTQPEPIETKKDAEDVKPKKVKLKKSPKKKMTDNNGFILFE